MLVVSRNFWMNVGRADPAGGWINEGRFCGQVGWDCSLFPFGREIQGIFDAFQTKNRGLLRHEFAVSLKHEL
jgi:hypothetical protein